MEVLAIVADSAHSSRSIRSNLVIRGASKSKSEQGPESSPSTRRKVWLNLLILRACPLEQTVGTLNLTASLLAEGS
jgi:hypothetical protein